MSILILYATNSGGTQIVCEIIAKVLEDKGHTVKTVNVRGGDPELMNTAEAVVLASPSWDYHGMEGQPHEDMRDFINKAEKNRFEGKPFDFAQGKPFAVAGLGDLSYMYFTGAVDKMEKFVKEAGGTLSLPSLRIDGFFFDQERCEAITRKWAEELAASLVK